MEYSSNSGYESATSHNTEKYKSTSGCGMGCTYCTGCSTGASRGGY